MVRTWVLCANASRAKIFRLDLSLGQIECVVELAAFRSEFSNDVAVELEFACGFDGYDRVVLCGEFGFLNKVCQGVSDRVRRQIIGIIPSDLVGMDAEKVRALAEPVALKKSA